MYCLSLHALPRATRRPLLGPHSADDGSWDIINLREMLSSIGNQVGHVNIL